MKLKIFISILFVNIFYSLVLSQNQISVPFNNGFVGNNTANNQSTVSYYTAGSVGLGWTNLQFTQNSSAFIFTLQGNDIVGSVLITDVNGIEHNKWIY